jgi:hypothetical protein
MLLLSSVSVALSLALLSIVPSQASTLPRINLGGAGGVPAIPLSSLELIGDFLVSATSEFTRTVRGLANCTSDKLRDSYVI